MIDRQTDRRTDICNCRVAFATEKIYGRKNSKLRTFFFDNDGVPVSNFSVFL